MHDLCFQALKEGSWVLLDEINLAQQSVLEAKITVLLFIEDCRFSFACSFGFFFFRFSP